MNSTVVGFGIHLSGLTRRGRVVRALIAKRDVSGVLWKRGEILQSASNGMIYFIAHSTIGDFYKWVESLTFSECDLSVSLGVGVSWPALSVTRWPDAMSNASCRVEAKVKLHFQLYD